MLTVDDIEIKIKKWNREHGKNEVIVNLRILEAVEMRGFIVRYTTTKHSPVTPVWIVTPPSIRGRNKVWFHIVRFVDTRLWEQIDKRIIELVKEDYSTKI